MKRILSGPAQDTAMHFSPTGPGRGEERRGGVHLCKRRCWGIMRNNKEDNRSETIAR